jgi:hypothetical protein
MKVRLAVAAIFAAFLTSGTPARATLYNWTYGGDGHHSGSGTLTTTGATSPFTITAFTGTFDGVNSLQLLDPGDCCGIPDNDNLLYSPPSTLLDGSGLAFENSHLASFRFSSTTTVGARIACLTTTAS